MKSQLVRFGIAAIALAACLAPKAMAEEWTRSYSVSGRPTVVVNTNDGAVRVTTGDSKQVVFQVIYEGLTVDKNLKIDSNQNGDRVEVTARIANHFGFSWNMHRGLRIEVHMPKDADLQVESGDGSVETQTVIGNVNIHTGDGHIRVDGAKGDIHLRTGDGSIEGYGLDGKVEADTGDGHVKLAGRFDVLSIKTGDGSINASANSGSKLATGWMIHTGDGSVDLTLPSDLQANIEASTNDGRISLGIPLTVEGTMGTSKIQGKMNGGGQTLNIHTGDGSIRLNKS